MESNKKQKLGDMSDDKTVQVFNPNVKNFTGYLERPNKLHETMEAMIDMEFDAFIKRMLGSHFPSEGNPKDGYKFNGHGGHFVRLMHDARETFKAMKEAF